MSTEEHAVKEHSKKRLSTKEGKRLFDLPRRISASLNRCREEKDSAAALPGDVRYLWASFHAPADGALRVEDWMNVVDEAASLGLTFIVFSVEGRLNDLPELWPVCKWAQDAHRITVGLHTNYTDFTREELDAFKQLDLEKARLYVRSEDMDRLQNLESEGIRLRVADPRGAERANPAPCCDLPRKMLYVDPHGVMYTCKYVRDNADFRVGHCYERTFQDVVDDPNRPSVVPDDVPFIAHGCDGCPPIVEEEDTA